MEYPKFEKSLKDKIINPQMQQQHNATYGVIIKYDKVRNLAGVLCNQPGSNQMGQIYQDVPCPVNLGIQTVAPKAGDLCNLQFKDGANSTMPFIISFFNVHYEENNYYDQTKAGNLTPRFIYDT